jgi:predicted RNase H-like HicB family nuclease
MQAITRRYTVLLYPEPDEDGYSVIVPLLDGCVTHGRTLDDALANAREAIEGHVATLAELGEEVPDEEAPPAVVTVEVTTRPSTSGTTAAATSH